MGWRSTAGWMLAAALLALAGCGSGSGRYTGTDLAVSGTGPTAPVMGGEAAVFVMTVANLGDYEASGAVVTTLLGNQLALAGISCTASGGATCPAQATVSVEVPPLPAGGKLVFEVNAQVLPGANGVVSSTMSVALADDNDRSNNSATATATATSNSVGVSATAPDGPIAGGSSVAFAFVVANDGPGDATEVVLVNTLSAGLSPDGAIACLPAGGAAPTVAMPDGSLQSALLPAGASLSCTVNAVVTAGTNAAVSSTMTASARGDSRAGDNSATASVRAESSDLGVSQSSEAQTPAGKEVSFTAVVANAGPGSASNVQIAWSHSPGLTFDPPTCRASAGATCPAVLGPVMTVASLPSGRSLTFTFTAPTGETFRGSVSNTLSVSSDEDVEPANNSATTTTAVVDPRNGGYSVFGADGKPYTMTIDFDAGSYSISGSGVSLSRSFSFDAASGDYVVSAGVRLRTATDLVVGGEDFGGGVLPYVAARKFAASVASIAGSFGLATRNLPASGAAVTHAGTALVSGNTLSICQSESVQVVPVRNCAADARKDYLGLRVSGSGFVGVTASGESYSFAVAESGALKLLLSAGPAAGTQQFRIGLIDSSGGMTFGPPTSGSSTTGEWTKVTLAQAGIAVDYTATSASASDSADLVVINAGGAGPFSMMVGTSTLYNANIYVMQASPLVFTVGGVLGSASGLLTLGLP